MLNILLRVLEESLRAYNQKLLREFLDAKEKWQKEIDLRSSGQIYSQLTIDRSLRKIRDIAAAYCESIPRRSSDKVD